MGKRILVTCRLCDKLNDDMNICAIHGPLKPWQVDDAATAEPCLESGDYVRLFNAVPNEYNYGLKTILDEDKEMDESELLIYSRDESGFLSTQGITLEQWAEKTFNSKKK